MAEQIFAQDVTRVLQTPTLTQELFADKEGKLQKTVNEFVIARRSDKTAVPLDFPLPKLDHLPLSYRTQFINSNLTPFKAADGKPEIRFNSHFARQVLTYLSPTDPAKADLVQYGIIKSLENELGLDEETCKKMSSDEFKRYLDTIKPAIIRLEAVAAKAVFASWEKNGKPKDVDASLIPQPNATDDQILKAFSVLYTQRDLFAAVELGNVVAAEAKKIISVNAINSLRLHDQAVVQMQTNHTAAVANLQARHAATEAVLKTTHKQELQDTATRERKQGQADYRNAIAYIHRHQSAIAAAEIPSQATMLGNDGIQRSKAYTNLVRQFNLTDERGKRVAARLLALISAEPNLGQITEQGLTVNPEKEVFIALIIEMLGQDEFFKATY